MKVIKPSRIREFYDRYPDSKSSLTGWLTTVKEANWKGLNDMRRTVASADIVPTPKGPIAVFNIRGNKYRLLCAIHFNPKDHFCPRFSPSRRIFKGNLETDHMKTTSLKAEMEAAFRELPTTYEELCRLYLPRKIHDKAECQRATAVVDALSIREDLNKDQLDYVELVGDLVNEYEKHHVAQPENSSPVEVLRYLMEENRISTRQMSRILGKDESIVSKILKGERSITIEHARKFGHHFGVNPGLFLRLSDE